MKKHLFKKYIFFCLAIFLFFPLVIVQGQQTIYVTRVPGDIEPADTFRLQDFLEGLASWVFFIVIMLAMVFILVAAYYFLTAQGDSTKITRARDQLIYALIGTAVAVSSWALIRWVATFMGGGAGAP